MVESRDIRLIDGKGTLIGAAVWPYGGYERRSHPLVGSTAAPHATYELLLVVRVHGPGVWRWPQTELTYRLRGRTYRTVVDFGFSVCPHRVQC